MTVDWRIERLGDVCSFEKIQGFHADLPYVGLENIGSGTGKFEGSSDAVGVKSATFRFTKSHVLYGRLRPYLNKVLLPDFDGHCSTEIFPIQPSEIVLREYLFHWLSMDKTVKAIDATCTGARMPRANMNAVLDFNLPVPPLSEQQRIVTILNEAFEGIAAAKTNAEENQRNALALLECHSRSVFNQHTEGAEQCELAEVCSINSKLVDPRNPPFLDLMHVGAGNVVSKTGELVQLKTAREEELISGKFLFDESTVLYSKIRPYLMKVARPDFNGLCSADMYPLTANAGKLSRDYLFHLLLSKDFTDYAITGSARAGMPKVNREHLFAYTSWIPPLARQVEVAAVLDALHAEIQALDALYTRKLAALDKLKQSLLHQAFSGQL